MRFERAACGGLGTLLNERINGVVVEPVDEKSAGGDAMTPFHTRHGLCPHCMTGVLVDGREEYERYRCMGCGFVEYEKPPETIRVPEAMRNLLAARSGV